MDVKKKSYKKPNKERWTKRSLEAFPEVCWEKK